MVTRMRLNIRWHACVVDLMTKSHKCMAAATPLMTKPVVLDVSDSVSIHTSSLQLTNIRIFFAWFQASLFWDVTLRNITEERWSQFYSCSPISLLVFPYVFFSANFSAASTHITDTVHNSLLDFTVLIIGDVHEIQRACFFVTFQNLHLLYSVFLNTLFSNT
jgi:hypothetical protein